MAQNYTRQSTLSDGDTITASLFNDEYNQLVNAFTYSSTSASSTGHRHDGSAGQGGNIFKIGDLDFLNKIEVDSTNNRWGFYVEVSSAAVEQIRIQDGAIVPVTDNDIDLGTSSLEFKDLFIDGTAHIDTLDVDANATIAGTLGVTGATTLSSTLGVTDATTLSSTLAVTGAATLSSTLAVTGTTTLTGNVTTTNDLSVGGNLTVTGTTTFNGGTITMGDAATDNVVFGADVDSHIIPDDDDTYDLGSTTQQWRNLYIDGTAEIDTLSLNGTNVTATATEINLLDGVTATTAELNLLDGVTSTTAELNILDGVTATATEINLLDGVTATTAELNILDGVTSTAAELNLVDGSVAGTVTNSKAVVYGAAGEVNATTLQVGGVSITSTPAELNILDGATVTTAELNLLDGVTSTTAELNILDGVTATTTELNYVDGVTSAIQTQIDTKAPTASPTFTGTVTIPTADVNGGNIDGTTIGATTTAAGSFTTLQADTSLNVDGTVTADDVVVDDGTVKVKYSTDPTSTVEGLQLTSQASTTGRFLPAITWGYSDSSPDFSLIEATRGSSTGGRLHFATATTAGTMTERVLVDEAGDVAFYDDSGNKKLYWDASVAYLGVGSVTPNYLLDVEGSGSLLRVNATSGNAIQQFSVSDTTSITGITFGDSGSTTAGSIYYRHTGDSMAFSTAGVEALRIQSDKTLTSKGAAVFNEDSDDADFRIESDSNTHAFFLNAGNSRIGLNQSDPSYALHIGDGTQGERILLETSGGGASIEGKDSVNAPSDSFRIGHLTGTNRYEGAIGTTNLWLFTTTDLIFKPSGGERFRIGTNETVVNEASIDYNFRVESNSATHMLFVDGGTNRVGINNSNPSTTFHSVSANTNMAKFEGLFSGDVAYVSLLNDATSATGNGSGLEFRAHTTTNERQQAFIQTGWTDTTDATRTSAFVINQTIAGAGREVIDSTGDAGLVINQSGIDYDFRVESDSNTHMLFVDAGTDKVGINQSSPQQSLHVAGSGITYMRATGGTGTTGIDFGQHSNTNGYVWLRDDTTLLLGTNAAERARFSGTTTTFNEDGNDTDFRVESDNNSNAIFVDAGSEFVGIMNSTDFGGALNVNGGLNSKQAVFTSTNNRGIALSTATRSGQNDGVAIVDAQDTEGTGGRLELHTMGAERARFERDQIVFNEGSNDQDFRVESDGNANMLFVDASQNSVGIGTNSPSSTYALDVVGSIRTQGTAPGLTIYETDASNQQWILGGYGGTLAARDVTGGTYPFQITTGAPTNSILIQSSGVTVNDNSADQDFRVESNNDANAFVVNAGTDNIGMGTNNPSFSAGGGLRIERAATATLRLQDTGSHGFEIRAEANAAQFYSANNRPYHFLDSNSNQLFAIDNSGNGTFTNHGAGQGAGPYLNLYRNSASPADGDDIGIIQFQGEDSVGNLTTYASVSATIHDVSNGTEDGRFNLNTTVAGSSVSRMYMLPSSTIFNEASGDIDFRVESNNNANMLFVDGANDTVGIGTNSTIAQVTTATPSSKMAYYTQRVMGSRTAAVAVDGSSNAKTVTIVLTNVSLHGQKVDIHTSGHYFNNGANTFYRHTKYYLMSENTNSRISDRTDVFLGGSQTGEVGTPSITLSGSNTWTITIDIGAGYVTDCTVYVEGPGADQITSITFPDQ